MRYLVPRFALVGLVAVSAVGTGCAQERDPVNRVQANALDKRFFVGPDIADPTDDPEFYSRTYVVDASASQSVLGPGSGGGVDRIRWEITENMLYARKAYQISDGEDCRGIPKADPNKLLEKQCDYLKLNAPTGTIVAAYRIRSHFDIRRDYLSSTGQETNVTVENSSDRPWQQREYMRVDWSSNLVDNPMEGSLWSGPMFGQFLVTAATYSITDPLHEDAPHFETEKGTGRGYFDITNKYTITPAGLFRGMGIPTCMLLGSQTGSGTYECNPQEATVRHSFWQIDPDHDFEPLENTRFSQDVVGNPGGYATSGSIGSSTSGRQTWDPQYGFTDGGYVKFASIHNNWKKSHQAAACDTNEDRDRNGTADQCENSVTGHSGHQGSQCDVHTKKCTIPVRDREIKPIGYWINVETPDSLLDVVAPDGSMQSRGALEDVIGSFNQLMSIALATRREVECRRTGDGDRDSCHAEFFESTSDPKSKVMITIGGWLVEKPKEPTPALVFCHNPVRGYDNEICGEPGARSRLGDIRKNFIFYWPHNSRAPWGGIAYWKADPLTGEMLGAGAQVMGHASMKTAAQARDAIQLAIGDLTIDQIMDGPQTAYTHLLAKGDIPHQGLTPAEMNQRLDAVDLASLHSTLGLEGSSSAAQMGALDQLKAEVANSFTNTIDPSGYAAANFQFDALADSVRGSKMEANMLSGDWGVSSIGISPGTVLDKEMYDLVSPLRSQDLVRQAEFMGAVGDAARDHGLCFMDAHAPMTGSVTASSLAGYYKNKFGNMDAKARGEAIFNELFVNMMKGVTLHELGHSLGMFHNFASSWDSVNYTPQYWQLRTGEGKASVSCNREPRAGAVDTCMGPRYIDPETSDELGLAGESRPNILFFADTSTMEYPYERFIRALGNGTYDQHAMKALYGRVLETFDDRVMDERTQQFFRDKHVNQQSDREIFWDDDNFPRRVHYTEMARLMKVFDPERDCRPATAEEKAKAEWRIVHDRVCSPPPKDHWAWQDFISDPLYADTDTNAPYWHVKTREGKHLVRWPYRWGQSNGSFSHVNSNDAGADIYEVVNTNVRKFEMDYPFTYFRRQRREYTARTPAAVTSGLINTLRAHNWNISFRLGLASQNTAARLNDDNDLKPFVMAEAEVFKFLSRIVTMPEPGNYYESAKLGTGAGHPQPVDATLPLFDTPVGADPDPKRLAPVFTVGLGQGRNIFTQYDNNFGGSWEWSQYVNHAGFSVEKTAAISALVDPRPTQSIVSRTWFLDSRKAMVNLRTAMPHAVDRLLGGVLAEDWESIAQYMTKDDAPPESINLLLRSSEPTRPAGARVIAPNIGFHTQMGAIVMPMLLSRLSTDTTLVEKMRIFVEGRGSRHPWTDPDIPLVEFVDPRSNFKYIARKFSNDRIGGKDVDQGIASRMLLHAEALKRAVYRHNTDGTVATDPTTGQPVMLINPTTAAGSAVKQQYDFYVGIVDSLAELERTLNKAPTGL